MANSALVGAETVGLAVLLMALTLSYAVVRLRRSRPDFNVGVPVAVAVAIRLWAIAGIAATGSASTLRGGDELTYMNYARQLAIPRGAWASARTGRISSRRWCSGSS